MDAYKAELSSFLEQFGANVRRLRQARQTPLSQEQLAGLSQLHRTEIGKIEQGVVEPRLTTLLILANALGVSVEDLVAGLRVPRERRPSPGDRSYVRQPRR